MSFKRERKGCFKGSLHLARKEKGQKDDQNTFCNTFGRSPKTD